MAMTGKYGGTSDPVTVTAEIEAALIERLQAGYTYDSGGDVEFYAVQDGIVIDVPVTGGVLTKLVFNFIDVVLEHQRQFLMDLKAIRDAVTPEETTMQAKVVLLETPPE